MPVAASAVGLASLGWVASPVIKDLVKKGISYLGSDMAEELDDLETYHLPQFQLTIEAAQKSNDKDKLAKLEKWLVRLKNAYYDAEAILHELEYKRLKRKAKGDRKKLWVRISSHPIIKPLRKITRKVSQKVSMLSPQKMKLWSHLKKLDKIAAKAKDFRELLGIQPGNETAAQAGNGPFETSSLLSHKVFGGDKVRDQIIKFLLDEQGASSSTGSYSVVAITGIGGDGKTTLAQYIYQDDQVKNHFGMRVWLCLSEKKDVREHIRVMIEGITGQESPNLLSLNSLHNKLESLSESKSILLVLDDVWKDQKAEQEWDDLLKPFSSTEGRCKIVITSRETLFPNALLHRKLITIKLSGLAEDDFKSLFRYYAMDGLEINDPCLKNELYEIGDEIAKKMIKSPLAAKVIGNQLQKCPEKSFWRETLKSDILSSTREVLLWSFQRLDVQLQRCFLFDSVFPKGSNSISANDMGYYWMALDFIQSSDIGFQYFNTMVANSMQQLVDGRYYMHDLFCDLAENLSVGDCFRVTNFEKEIPSSALYAYIEVNNESWNNNISNICNSRNLRAFILDTEGNPLENLNKLLPMVCTKFKNLRVLELWSWDLKELPSAIGDLKNLRYLDVWHSSITELPNSVTQLYHLQFLLLPTSIKILPPKLSDLLKLRSIVKYDRNYNLVHSLPPVPYVGKLTSLQSLSEFHVRKEEGYELCQLGSLNEIAGSLRIVNLENVRQKGEAIKARLIEKPKLKRLELIWAESSESGLDSEVIEALKPTDGLEYLSIKGYGGSRCPSWFLEGSFLKNIKYLEFYNCSALTDLPHNFHQLCPYLTEFRVGKCPSLIFICENELQLNENNDTMGENPWLHGAIYDKIELKNVFHHEIQSFKKIDPEQNSGEKLKIIELAAEDSAPELTTKVQNAWWQCHQQRMKFIFSCKTEANKLILSSTLHILFISFCCISDGALSDCLRGMATLKELYLQGIRSVKVITIKSCWCLRSLGGLHVLPNLEILELDSCPSLEIRCGKLFPLIALSDFSVLVPILLPTCTELFSSLLLPPSLQTLHIQKCRISQAVLLKYLLALHSYAVLCIERSTGPREY